MENGSNYLTTNKYDLLTPPTTRIIKHIIIRQASDAERLLLQPIADVACPIEVPATGAKPGAMTSAFREGERMLDQTSEIPA
jgi:hypothetical protein